jgi:hypothetical protein
MSIYSAIVLVVLAGAAGSGLLAYVLTLIISKLSKK